MINSDRKYDTLLGIKLNSTSRQQVLARVRNFITHSKRFYITTPNPELVLMSQKDLVLEKVLNSADISVPDGRGLNFASKFLWGRSINIIPGRKLFMDLVELANKKAWKVFFLGGEKDESILSAQKLKLSYKRIKIEAFSGPIVDENAIPVSEKDKKLNSEAIEKINSFKPELLFVAMVNPKQEKWIYKNIKNLDIGGAMAVGGTLRYIAGYSKLPPKWMEKMGLEWFWRLITEPWRTKRILNALIAFPIRVFREKFQLMFGDKLRF